MVSLASGTLKKKTSLVVCGKSGCFGDASDWVGVVLRVLLAAFVVDEVTG